MYRNSSLLVDSHCHCWDETCALVSHRTYSPARPTPYAALAAAWSSCQVDFGVLVQPSFLGTDNGYLLDRLAADPRRLRGVVQINDRVAAEELERMHAAGVRGIRFNLASGGPLPDLSGRPWRTVLRWLADHDWHVVAAARDPQWPDALPTLAGAGLPLVVDHLGWPDPAQGPRSPGFRALRDWARRIPMWVKVSAPYRAGNLDVVSVVRALLDTPGPDRLMWGSDFPWLRFEEGKTYPAVLADARRAVAACGGVEAIFGANAARLYGLALPPQVTIEKSVQPVAGSC